MSHKKNIFILIFVVGVISQASLYNLGGFWKGPGTPVAEWAWMTGTKNRSNELSVYGTQGVAAAANTPGARVDFMTWTDSTNRLWLYGGSGHDVNSDYGNMADLWNYNPATGQWTWVSGPQTAFVLPNHGTINVSSSMNSPGARAGALTWADQSNDILWLFGGETHDSGFMSDLWKYTISTGQWTWVHGPSTGNNTAVLGTIGVPSVTNNPSARATGTTWRDQDGGLWFFGGEAFGRLYNDVWHYTPSTDEWTWFKGNSNSFVDYVDGPAVYGTKGVSADANTPSGRFGGNSWIQESAGVLWLFGGKGFDGNGDYGLMNDIWKFELSNKRWTWVAGDSTRNQNSVPGTQGVPSTANKIGAKVSHAIWEDASGLVWIFGGQTYGLGCEWESNDLWTYNPTNNEVTWIDGDTNCGNTNNSGTKGVGSTANHPSARIYGLGFWQNTSSNLFYFFGGQGVDVNTSTGNLNDLWRFNPTNGQWTWLTGSVEIPVNLGVYGTKGIPSASNEPGARGKSKLASTDDGSVWIFGGQYYSFHYGCFGCTYNSLFRYNPTTNQWTWMTGDVGLNGVPVYGTQGTPSALNNPEPLQGHAMVKDSNGMIWVFGGQPNSYQYTDVGSNNLWRYNPSTNQWTWMTGAGNSFDQYGNYGTQGVPGPARTPGSRINAAMAADSLGNLWLFGGRGYGASGSANLLNDLWKFDTNTNQWTWVTGSTSAGQINGVYGTKGVANPSNVPGSRDEAHLWVDTNNHLFLHGGEGYERVNNYEDRMSDTWRFDGTNWTWVHGPDNTSLANVATVWGVPGVFSPANIPGARTQALSFQERGGYFWLMGGFSQDSQGFGGYTPAQDLWKFDPVSLQWACAHACADSFFGREYVVATTKGVPSPSIEIGNKLSSAGTIDRFGNIWIYGGYLVGEPMFWRYK
jgi:N-acetylneuraminic acid mutarotase